MFSYIPLFSITGKKKKNNDWMLEDGLRSQTDYFGRSVAFFFLFLATQSLCVWMMRTIIIIIICFHVGSFVRSFFLFPRFFCSFIFCLTRSQIIKTAESNKTNARSSLLSRLTRSDAKQIDKYIMKQRKKEILTAMIQFTLINAFTW